MPEKENRDEERFIKALEYTIIKHDGQYRQGGLPYVTHPLSVSEMIRANGYGIEYRIAGLFHDLLEDTDAEKDEILELGGPKVLEAVQLLTKEKGYVMADYIAHIKENEIAYAVKGYDRLHNLRCAFTTNEEFKRRYILETIDWYMEFNKDIPLAVKSLAESMEKPMAELSLIYEYIDSWKI